MTFPPRYAQSAYAVIDQLELYLLVSTALAVHEVLDAG